MRTGVEPVVLRVLVERAVQRLRLVVLDGDAVEHLDELTDGEPVRPLRGAQHERLLVRGRQFGRQRQPVDG